MHFLRFRPRFCSYVKVLPKTKRYNSVAVMVSVRFWCICVTALTVKFGWSIVYIEESQFKMSKNIIFLSLKIDSVLANNACPHGMPRLPGSYPFRGFHYTKH